MRLSLVATLRRHRAIVAAFSAALLAAVPAHAQATGQPVKTPPPKTTAAPATPAKAPATAAPKAAPTTPAPTAAAPKQPATSVAKPAVSPVAPKPVSPTSTRVFVDINHATAKELKNIPGIGDAYAAKIIAGRPYANKSQLVSKKIVNESLYETIQGMIIAKK